MNARRVARIAPPLHQPLGQVVEHLVRPYGPKVLHAQHLLLAHNPRVEHLRRAHQLGRQFQHMVWREFGLEAVVGELHPIAGQSGEPDLERVPVRADGPHANRPHGLHRRSDHGLGGEVERDAQHVRVLDVEEVVVVEFVRHPAERTSYSLLAE